MRCTYLNQMRKHAFSSKIFIAITVVSCRCAGAGGVIKQLFLRCGIWDSFQPLLSLQAEIRAYDRLISLQASLTMQHAPGFSTQLHCIDIVPCSSQQAFTAMRVKETMVPESHAKRLPADGTIQTFCTSCTFCLNVKVQYMCPGQPGIILGFILN